ncbi:hypothetical protein DF947_10430 [Pedobacter paludis]|uniref:MarR family transcriptional regulator n=1 Tax=Pedobacter paludis TaxID=2203212 RepID=A0A317F2A6_9SPHI|nr:hypothetical protein DF947_10430 [Pedobacter paludis]
MSSKEMVEKISIVISDTRLNVWHLAIIIAIIQLGHDQLKTDNIRVSRGRIMTLAHITSVPTYHKYFKQLQSLGYIEYYPSYHPGYRSTVRITF